MYGVGKVTDSLLKEHMMNSLFNNYSNLHQPIT